MSFRRIATEWTTDTATHLPQDLRLKLMAQPRISDAGTISAGIPTATETLPSVEASIYGGDDFFIFT